MSATLTPSEKWKITRRANKAKQEAKAAERAAAPRPIEPPEMPPMPPKTEAELAADREISERLRRVVAELRQRNPDNAVLLAQQAAAGRGPLVEHFRELGRRYGELLDAPPRPCLRVVKGGRT
jgi:hypothetical protein